MKACVGFYRDVGDRSAKVQVLKIGWMILICNTKNKKRPFSVNDLLVYVKRQNKLLSTKKYA